MSTLIHAAIEYERRAEMEPDPFRAACYRRLAALAVQMNADDMASRLRAGSSVAAEIGAMVGAAQQAALANIGTTMRAQWEAGGNA